MTKSLRTGQHTVKGLSEFFTSFNEAGIKFVFEQDKTKVSGKLTKEKNKDKDYKMKL